MSNTTGLDVAKQAWDKIQTAMPLNEDCTGSTNAWSERLGLSINVTRTAFQMFRKLGMMDMRTEYQFQKQTVYYRVIVDRATGFDAIEKHFAMGRGFHYYKDLPTTRKTTIAATKAARAEETTVAIVGPDPEAPMAALRGARKDDAEALIEAARQYAVRGDAVVTKLAELEALGIEIDREKFAKSIKMEVDPALDAVSVLLPMFDRMARTIERLSEHDSSATSELKETRRENGRLTTEVGSLRDANRRLSERNASLAGELTEQRSKMRELAGAAV